MNGTSIAMAKRMDSHLSQCYAFRLIVATVVLSWAGWQALLISGADHLQGDSAHTLLYLESGLVLLFYSLLTLLRLKRNETLPARESVQLFFGVLLVGLPLLTWYAWRHIKLLLADHHRHQAANVGSVSLLYACIIISIAYLVMILVWLQTNVTSYDDARPGSWPNRMMGWLHSSVIEPYFK
jgi:Sec-independent protein secretion pathway component TatC